MNVPVVERDRRMVGVVRCVERRDPTSNAEELNDSQIGASRSSQVQQALT